MPSEEAIDPVTSRRADVALLGLAGELDAVRPFLTDANPAVRSSALSSLARHHALSEDEIARAIGDPDPLVRRRICELAGYIGPGAFEELLDDADAHVVEAAAFACGEQERARSLVRLVEIAQSHGDPLCRESAVAALGVLGLPEGLETLLGALGDVATIRRRAVIALSNYESEAVNAALTSALGDRDWQVRQAAEDVLGINRTPTQ